MKERVALITGGRRGIGLGIGVALAGEGWRLVLNGRSGEPGPGVERLQRSGAEVHYAAADIAEEEGRRRLLGEVRERFGRLDLLVNNAGVAPQVRADPLEADPDDLDRLWRVNARGPFLLTRDAAAWMLEQRRADRGRHPAIVFVSSVSAELASPDRAGYCLSKAALSMAARLWAVRLAPEGIPVWEVQPGLVRTDMTERVRERYDRLIEAHGLLEARWGTPADVGRAVAMLARGDLPYAPGQILRLDGGLSLPRLTPPEA